MSLYLTYNYRIFIRIVPLVQNNRIDNKKKSTIGQGIISIKRDFTTTIIRPIVKLLFLTRKYEAKK